jgi:hypothetical protein
VLLNQWWVVILFLDFPWTACPDLVNATQIKAVNLNPNPIPMSIPLKSQLWSVRGRKTHTGKDQAKGSGNKVKVNESRDECKSHSLKLQVIF